MSITTNRPNGQASRSSRDRAEFNRDRAAFMSRVQAYTRDNPSQWLLGLAYVLAYRIMDSKLQQVERYRLEKIADLVGGNRISARTIQRLLATLEGLGLIVERGSGRGMTSVYRIAPAPVENPDAHATLSDGKPGAHATLSRAQKGDTGSAKGCHAETQKGGMGATPSLEESPKKESLQSSAGAGRRGDSVFDDDTSRTTSPTTNTPPAAKPVAPSPSDQRIIRAARAHGLTPERLAAEMVHFPPGRWTPDEIAQTVVEGDEAERNWERFTAFARQVVPDISDKAITDLFMAMDLDSDRAWQALRKAKMARDPRAYIWTCINRGSAFEVIDGGRQDSRDGFGSLPYEADARDRQRRRV